MDGKELTVGGNRAVLLEKLGSVMLLEDPHAADGYDAGAPKNFYTTAAQGDEAEPPPPLQPPSPPSPPPRDGSPVERVETAEERDGEMHYLLKYRGRDAKDNCWVAQSALPDAHAVELVAAFEESQLEEVPHEDSLEPDEFYVEALLDRRVSRRTGTPEYLVRWGGFAEDEDCWEPMDGLPADMVEAFDAEQKAIRAAKRSKNR